MRRFILTLCIFLALSAVGCRRHTFHTYYGDIDIDTMNVAFNVEGHDWYEVHWCAEDSFYWLDEWFYMKGPIIMYYCPYLDKYMEEFPDNHGTMISVDIDPYTAMDWLNK